MKSYRNAISFLSYCLVFLALAESLEEGDSRKEKLGKLISDMFDNINKKLGGVKK